MIEIFEFITKYIGYILFFLGILLFYTSGLYILINNLFQKSNKK